MNMQDPVKYVPMGIEHPEEYLLVCCKAGETASELKGRLEARADDGIFDSIRLSSSANTEADKISGRWLILLLNVQNLLEAIEKDISWMEK